MRSIQTTILLLFVTINCFAQLRVDRVIPPSFNAAAIIKYIDHPVGVKYGVPKIKLPIKTLVNNDLFVPISLNYHTLGVKVEEEATWTGLGWHLEAGGVITRIIRGENDFGLVDDPMGSNKALGYPFEHIKPCLDDCAENENDAFHSQVCAGEIDSDPDIFFFNIMGMKGKFLLTPDHDKEKKSITINIIRPRKMTATFDLTDNFWTIEDAAGYTYVFKNRELTRSINSLYDHKKGDLHTKFDFHTSLATTSWYISKIISPSGKEAKFKYDVDIDGVSKYLSNGTFQKMNINDEEVWDVHYSSYCYPDNIEAVIINSENLHSDVYLKSITSGDQEVRFTKSQQKGLESDTPFYGSGTTEYIKNTPSGFRRQQLDKIEFLVADSVIASAEFQYSRHKTKKPDNNLILNHRLKLDSMLITKRGKVSRMGFGYMETTGLPSKESHARDLWGFYNGEETTHNITPSDYFNYSQPEKMLQEEGKTLHYSLEHIKEGVLDKIDYGNGKVRTYDYDHQEFHEISTEISSHFEAGMTDSNFKGHMKPYIFGGLRVKEIIESYPKEKIYKDYFYKINGKEMGKLQITHYSHDHDGFGHKTSGNHCIKYSKVRIKTGKLFNGHKF
ncbi:MAG: hypothetical protein OCD76_24125 [Reichenbachiella sp.]